MKSISSSLLLAIFTFILSAVADQLVLADTPPACLLQALNTQSKPSNLSAICGNEATDIQLAIASLCEPMQLAAQSAFIATCSSAGSSVAPYISASSTSRTTADPSSSAYIYTTTIDGSTILTSTAGATATKGGSAPSGTISAGGTSATGNAAADVKQVGSFAAAVIAIAGVVAIL